MPSTRLILAQRPWRRLTLLRLLEALVLLVLVVFILQNRLALGRAFLFVYGDEDQTLLWHAGMDLLHGRIPEPCFYGQSFNSCLEGYLAAPLLWAKMPPWYAVPTVTIFLGLVPFLAIALSAWRRERPALAAFALLIPAALPVRYAMLTGMPRGFITGIALAIPPCLMLLDPPAATSMAPKPRPRPPRWCDALRFFSIGVLAVIALTINPNCCLLLAPALAYALATRIRQAAFWLYSSLGALLGTLYPLGIFYFYFKLHDDYRFYHRESHLTWSSDNFRWLLAQFPGFFADFLPPGVPASATTWFLASGFAAVFLYLLLTRRFAAAFATLAAVAFTLYTIGFSRVHEGRSSVFFAFSRMYLALPVLPPLLLLWGSPRPKYPAANSAPATPPPPPPGSPAASPSLSAADVSVETTANRPSVATAAAAVPRRSVVPPALRLWFARVLLLLFCILALLTTRQHTREIPAVVAREVQNVQMVELITYLDGWELAQALQEAAAANNAHVVLLVDNEKRWTYLLPVLSDCQTLYPFYERRTWRLVEESLPRHERLLVLNRNLFDKALRAGYPHATIVRQTPFIGIFDTNGKSLIRICQELNVPIRPFRVPDHADLLR